jgi:integrase
MRILRKPVVVVYVRHAGTCPHREDESYPRCDCPKAFRWSLAGKQYRKAAGTRTWGLAEAKAAELQRQLDGGGSPSIALSTTPTIAALVATFMTRKLSEGIGPATERKLRDHLGRFESFMTARSRFFPGEITATDMVEFKAGWSTWKSSVTRQKAQQNVRGFVRFACRDNRDELLDALGKIKATRQDSDRLEPKPFTEAELETLLAHVPRTFPDPVKAARLTALIHLQVSTGLAIRDAVTLEVSSLDGGYLRIKRQKTGRAVTQKLDAGLHQELLGVTNGNPRFVFWDGASLPNSAVGLWLTDLRTLMKHAGVWIKGNVAHRFRDTAVDFWLGAGCSMTEIAAMIGDNVSTVEKHYAHLASKRMQDRLEKVPVRSW